MTIIILSDIHGNLPALEAVVDTFPSGPREIITAGDIVGYGAQPAACLSMIRSICDHVVLGNHDAAASGAMSLSRFNTYARQAAEWTKNELSAQERAYLGSLPYVIEDPEYTLVHGTLHSPERFYYLTDRTKALKTFRILNTRICFVGHSHVPGTFLYKNGSVEQVTRSRVEIKKGMKCLVNVGSVGQPRDRDNRACYCVYDPEHGYIELKRVEYDIERARRRIYDAGLPRILGDRLLAGQ